MAKALECPACGAKHRLDGLEPSSTFRCDRCGQKLKVPAAVSASAPVASAPVVPPPRRRSPGSPAAQEVIAASAPLGPTDANGNPPEKTPRQRPAAEPRRRVRWYWRIVAWLVAVPLGFLLTAVPAYELGLVGKDDVLDVFVGSGSDRYARLVVVTLLWALVTAVLVQAFVEGGRWWVDRRRERRAESPRGVGVPG